MREAWCNVDEETMQQCRIDAQVLLRKEECALSMGLELNDAAVKDAQIKLRREECVKGMGQRLNTNDAAARDAQTKLS